MSFHADQIILDRALFPYEPDLKKAQEFRDLLHSGKGKGGDFLGWLDLPVNTGDALIAEIEETAQLLKKNDAIVVTGIGGSYLGAKAVIEALGDPFKNNFPVYFAGHNLDSFYHERLFNHLKKLRYGVNIISKSGTTTEPAVAFRFLLKDLTERFGKESLKNLVVATTDKSRGSLKKLSDTIGLKTFIIPDDVGGRYSVISPVGLLPMAAAGLNIKSFVRGASLMREHLYSANGTDNPALLYASLRNEAYRSGKKIEILASFLPSLAYLSEWWKQLFGESEGKNQKGIFPAAVNLTTDLHSMGQWIQDGERNIFETVIDCVNRNPLFLPESDNDDDGLNYLSGKDLNQINRTALSSTLAAHASGGVPCIRIEIPDLNEEVMGALMYFFEYACGISAYMLGVNPFDQPGVESYKTEMFKQLKKPGYI